MSDDIITVESVNPDVSLTPVQNTAVWASDPVIEGNVEVVGPATHVVVTLEQRKEWTCRRVYSQYLSREVFTDPQGVEWVRISDAAFNPATDIQVEMRARGLSPMGLRRRDAAAANLKKES